MVFNDPNDMHVDAIENVVRNFRDSGNISFGIIRWGERVVRELVDYALAGDPVLFTKDESLLADAYTRMRQDAATNPDKYLGGTNYELALDAVRDYIVQDIAENPTYGAFAQYYVEFMTDGMPQAGAADAMTTRASILTKIDDLIRNYNVRVDVISIVEIATVTPEFFNLLPEMALGGGGSFIQLSTPDALDDEFKRILSADLMLFEYDLSTFTVANDPKSLLVINTSARVAEVAGVIDVYPDSDGDGIVDALEEEQGTDPGKADTDGDGLDDLFESSHWGEFDPLATMSPPLTEEQLADTDRDGLIFFVEERIGTDPNLADTDGDGVVDGIEYREGLNPLVKDLEADDDGDGVSNAFELRQHTHPQLAEPPELREKRSYKVEPLGDPWAIYNGRRCYRFLVGNITIAATMASLDLAGSKRPRGYNHIEVQRLERPLHDRKLSGMASGLGSHSLLGSAWIIFRVSSRSVAFRDPPALELIVRDANFEP